VAVAAVAAAATTAAGAIGAGAAPLHCGGGTPTLTVHGTGLATGTPDLLTLTMGVSVSGATAQAALSADNTSTTAVIAALTAGGVKKKEIQTTGLSIQPSYNQTGALTGYTVDNTVVAKITDFATAGSVIDAAAGAAGNSVRIDSLSFSIADPRALEDQARQDAVHQAVSHAGSMAAAAGERLAGVCSLTDDSTTSGGTTERFAPVASAAAGSTAVPVEAGSQQATAQVTLVYALAQKVQKHR
jgi:uncharacterized protein YggE